MEEANVQHVRTPVVVWDILIAVRHCNPHNVRSSDMR